ncbi:MAG TPA: cation diffusion facilitator family transporter [Candidatus Atribacteria bacterium]|nr:cation diffusion facilitator family transporter [Candidatus Atribacteria bacterium]HPT78893.1 cation diffusion facilitator family transporter [Candidatus Atribacteria bacterium]
MDRYKATRRIAVLGISANILLSILKLTVGYFSRSQAMLADGFNSAQDVFASLLTYIGNKIASKPEDREHPYGHGKAEYVFAMMISFTLLLVGFRVLGSSFNSIVYRQEFSFNWYLVYTAIGTIMLKFWLFFHASRVGRREDSLLIAANAMDHRNDVFVAAATLTSILLGSHGLYWVDGVVGVGISGWIILTGLRIFAGAYNVLMDTNIDQKVLLELKRIIEAVPGVDHVDNIASKPIGVSYILMIKVSVKGTLTVEEGHGIAARIKQELKSCSICGRVDDVIVHVNPA